jgi:hypothetical protein
VKRWSNGGSTYTQYRGGVNDRVDCWSEPYDVSGVCKQVCQVFVCVRGCVFWVGFLFSCPGTDPSFFYM